MGDLLNINNQSNHAATRQQIPDLLPLSNYDITEYFRGNPYFAACMSKDLLRREAAYYRGVLDKVRKFYIINNDDSTGPGSHWTLISLLHPEVAVYFDSFAASGPPTEVLTFMRHARPKRIMNDWPVQDMSTSTCGHFCCLVADLLTQGRKFSEIMSLFDNDTAKNEMLVRHWANDNDLRARR